jgi:hypothetical protein
MSASLSFQVSGPVPVVRALGVKCPVDTEERCVYVHVLRVDFEGQGCYSLPCLGRRTQQQLAVPQDPAAVNCPAGPSSS